MFWNKSKTELEKKYEDQIKKMKAGHQNSMTHKDAMADLRLIEFKLNDIHRKEVLAFQVITGVVIAFFVFILHVIFEVFFKIKS